MKKIRFTKMQGCANDYIYLDCIKNPFPDDIEKLAVEMSRRHFSVGSDGIICVCKPDCPDNDAKMRIFNADGSEGKMCGNGIRCVAKFLYDNGYITSGETKIESLSGVKPIKLVIEGGKCVGAVVGMGRAETECAKIPVIYAEKCMINRPIEVCGKEYLATAVSMGNPHAVVFLPHSPMELELEKIGPHFECHEIFPEKVNTEFVYVEGRNVLEMRVWERGSGETYACGTGACASAVAAVLNGLADANEPIKVKLLGGELEITVTDELDVTMSGPAETVYDGEYCGG